MRAHIKNVMFSASEKQEERARKQCGNVICACTDNLLLLSSPYLGMNLSRQKYGIWLKRFWSYLLLEDAFLEAAVRIPLGTPASHSGAWVQVLAPFPIPSFLLMYTLGGCLMAPCYPHERTRLPNSWLWPGPAPGVEGIWGVNQRKRFLFLSLSL